MTSAPHYWSNPPAGVPLDYAPEEPTYRGPHPLKRGLGAFLTVITVTLCSPLIVAGVVLVVLLLAISWCFDGDNDSTY